MIVGHAGKTICRCIRDLCNTHLRGLYAAALDLAIAHPREGHWTQEGSFYVSCFLFLTAQCFIPGPRFFRGCPPNSYVEVLCTRNSQRDALFSLAQTPQLAPCMSNHEKRTPSTPHQPNKSQHESLHALLRRSHQSKGPREPYGERVSSGKN